ncbi:MAG: L-rhamnose/proton symporter RhaT [Planctomycetota bacterium]
MVTNPALGIILHAVGGFAAGSFYAPLKKVRRWSWESYWLVMGIAAWMLAPWAVALLTTPELLTVLAASPGSAWGLCIVFGLLWGLGNLMFGLSVRYLGMALGFAMALGFCMIFGTLVPPIVEGRIGSILVTKSGLVTLAGVALCLGGIALCGWAGMRKERELTDQQKRESVSEFALGKGLTVAATVGVLSACFAFGPTGAG